MDNHRHACSESRQSKVEMKVRQIFNDNCRIWTWPYERFPCAVNWSVHFLIGAGKSYWMRCEQRRTEAATTGLWPLSTWQHSWNVALHTCASKYLCVRDVQCDTTSFAQHILCQLSQTCRATATRKILSTKKFHQCAIDVYLSDSAPKWTNRQRYIPNFDSATKRNERVFCKIK